MYGKNIFLFVCWGRFPLSSKSDYYLVIVFCFVLYFFLLKLAYFFQRSIIFFGRLCPIAFNASHARQITVYC